jgi:SCF-associated factor 1
VNKKIRTQGKIFTWGDTLPWCSEDHERPLLKSIPQLSLTLNQNDTSPVVSLQCTRNSVCVLRSDGNIYLNGIICPNDEPPGLLNPPHPHKLKSPEDSSTPYPINLVRSFSCGPDYILGLSRSGEILSWNSNSQPADIINAPFRSNEIESGIVKAGWKVRSVWLADVGIALWMLSESGPQFCILDQTRINDAAGTQPDTAAAISSIIVLQEYVLFTISTSPNLWAARMSWPNGRERSAENPGVVENPIELPFPLTQETTRPEVVERLEGSYWSKFAVLLRGGGVIILDEEDIRAAFGCIGDGSYQMGTPNPPETLAGWSRRIAALQEIGESPLTVQMVAFGERHFHAVHSNGTVTSYKTDGHQIGARHNSLGLGSHLALRGVHPTTGIFEASSLELGRQVWFQSKKEEWLGTIERKGCIRQINGTGPPALSGCRRDPEFRGRVGCWIEDEGRRWDQVFRQPDVDSEELGLHYTLLVASGALHSAAFVMENPMLVKTSDDYVKGWWDGCFANATEPQDIALRNVMDRWERARDPEYGGP